MRPHAGATGREGQRRTLLGMAQSAVASGLAATATVPATRASGRRQRATSSSCAGSRAARLGVWRPPPPTPGRAVSESVLAGSLWSGNPDARAVLQDGRNVIRKLGAKALGNAFEARYVLDLAVSKYLDKPVPLPTEVGIRASQVYARAKQLITECQGDSLGSNHASAARVGIRAHDMELLCAAGYLIFALQALRQGRRELRRDVFSGHLHAHLRHIQDEFDRAVELVQAAEELEAARRILVAEKRRSERTPAPRRPRRERVAARPRTATARLTSPTAASPLRSRRPHA